jgi:glycosyltransferase involved in cell wall biosynthesis
VVQQRGTEYWSHPEFYVGWSGRVDQLYNRLMIPLYCKRAVRVLTNSNTLGEELVRHVGVPRSKLRTVYASADQSFHPIADQRTIGQVRERYGLPPAPFLLMVVKGHQVLGQASGKDLTPRKNVAVTLEAYGRMRRRAVEAGAEVVPPLVILGLGIAERLTPELIAEHADPTSVHTPGFVQFEDMPVIYSMARALVFPSRYESFGIPIVEAMASGCPVVTSSVSACPEVAGDAALLVDPDDTDGLAGAMERVSFDDPLAEELRQRGLRRAASFSWTNSARTLLAELQTAAGTRRDARAN